MTSLSGLNFSKFHEEVGDDTNPSNQVMVVLSHGLRPPFLVHGYSNPGKNSTPRESHSTDLEPTWKRKLEQKNPCSAKRFHLSY